MKKTTMITVPVFWSGNAFWKTVEVALKKLLGGCVCVGGGGGTSPATYNEYPLT